MVVVVHDVFVWGFPCYGYPPGGDWWYWEWCYRKYSRVTARGEGWHTRGGYPYT